MRRNHKGSVRKLRWKVDAICANDSSHRSKLHGHVRQLVGDQFPVSRRETLSPRARFTDSKGFLPARVRSAGRRGIPKPVECRAVDALRRLGSEVGVRRQAGRRGGGDSLLLLDFPSFVCVGGLFVCGVSLQQESAAIAHLGERGMHAEVPDGGGQKVYSGTQKWAEVVSLKSPMGQVAAGRARSNAALINIEKKLVIGANVDDEMGRRVFEGEEFAKVEDGCIANWCIRASDPRSGPAGNVRGVFGGGHGQADD